MTTAYDESAAILAELNPFRYRGYLYDEESGLYYLRTRYYNPTWGRFMNADSLLGKTGALLSHNLFAYCGNNPVNMVDHNGKEFVPYKNFFQRLLHEIFLIVPEYKNELNPYEQAAVLRYPSQAISVMRTYGEARRRTDALYGAGAHKNDGRWSNAFLHAYWNALMVKRIMTKSSLDAHHLYGSLVRMRAMDIVGKFSMAHELINFGSFHKPWESSTVGQHTLMDLNNNAIGIQVGAENFDLSDEAISNIIYQQLEAQRSGGRMDDPFWVIIDE